MSIDKLTNHIILSRNDQGHYVVEDYMGTRTFERRENLMSHLSARLIAQDHRIVDYLADPGKWNVNGASELTC